MASVVSADEVRSRIQGLSLRLAQLSGRQAAEQQQKEELTNSVAMAKGRLALAPEISSVFEGLQTLAHERSVGSLEALLTAVLQDVLPDEGKIRLIPSYKANTTHLDILLEKGGHLEDLVDGNGGAVTNVVCAGLRFAALSRTGNRPLMVLDEPDCWLKPERVPAFVQTISQVSLQGGFQTFFITHHNPALFEGKFNLVRFFATEDGVSAKTLSPVVSNWESEDQPGLRTIELFNVRRHVHTVVPCFPGATAYIGDNNLGKSTALMAALKVVAYGESDDSIIRHGCDEARIILHLENGNRIEWSRSTKRSPTVMYRHFKGNQLIAEGGQKTRNQAPEWVQAVLGIGRVDDLDIQVGNQKTPVFLLNDSAPRRAQILSVGRESGYLPQLMRAYEARKAADRELVKTGEQTVARLRLREAFYGDLPRLQSKLQSLSEHAEKALAIIEKQQRLAALVQLLSSKSARSAALEKVVELQIEMPSEAPRLVNTDLLKSQGIRLARLLKLQAVTVPQIPPTAPVLADVKKMRELGVRWSKSTAKAKALASLDLLLCEFPDQAPVIPDTQRLQTVQSSLSNKHRAARAVAEETTKAESELSQATAALERLHAELGGVCPLCEGPLKEPHVHQHDNKTRPGATHVH